MIAKRIVILGATGMLGHTLFSVLSGREGLDVYATARNKEALSQWFAPELLEKVFSDVDADNFDSVIKTLDEVGPDIVINCIGIIKQLPEAQDPIASITINALLPHRLAAACRTAGARMIHFSTDCVFSGDKGNYSEKDRPDALDLYGRTKLLGEVEYPHCVTLRTSIIGHELKGRHGLIEWFLSQEGKVRGFTYAIYSGFPTVEMAHIVGEYVIPNEELTGLYHVSSHPISKYDLLRLVAERYGKRIEIERYDDFCCNRSLDSSLFQSVTGYNPPPWPRLINTMYHDATHQHDKRERR